MNKIWHEQNKMPAKATLEQRIRWHMAHQTHCGCREMPKGIVQMMKSK
jgi:hypothetical protein